MMDLLFELISRFRLHKATFTIHRTLQWKLAAEAWATRGIHAARWETSAWISPS